MKLVLSDIFSNKTKTKPLFIFEMANNHMGNVDHGIKIIRDFFKIAKKFDFIFAFKLQMRDIDTFIHPAYKHREDIAYVKRFSQTKLTIEEFSKLKTEIDKHGFISICTPFDEKSVDMVEKLQFDIIKVASCSFNDWPLLERIVRSSKPIIASTAGVPLREIDKVVSFFSHRGKRFALMHCVGEYPTSAQHFELNQIDLLKERYSYVPIGFSTHEEPDNLDAIKIAVAKGATLFERHVAIPTKKFSINKYSSTPQQIKKWLESAKEAFLLCGEVGKRAKFSTKEIADLRQFQRGVFAKSRIIKDERVYLNNTFFAFPNTDGQLVANDISKYTYYIAKKNIDKNEPIMASWVKKIDTREQIYAIVKKVSKILRQANITVPRGVDLEISHHYGIEKFYQYGMCMITVVNRQYCKKIIILLPNQIHPTQYHKRKEETFHILQGEFLVILDNNKFNYKTGDVVIIKPGVKHSFTTKTGGILEEISTTHYVGDSFYDDSKISTNKDRKTFVGFWQSIDL